MQPAGGGGDGGGGGGGRRQRKVALHAGAVLPTELLAQLAETGELLGSGSDLHLAETAETEPAAGEADVLAQRTPVAVPEPALSVPPPNAAAAAPGGPQSAASGEQLPAYTSLARQQLQQRLKAAIAAGTKASAATGAAQLQHQRQPAGQQPAAEGPRVQSPQPAWGASLPAAHGRPYPDSKSALPPLARPAGLQAAELDESSGCQLLLPSMSGTKPEQHHAADQRYDGRSTAAAAPHWLAGQLLQLSAGVQQQGMQRGPLTLRMPPLTGHFAELLPVRARDASGRPCLLVLPSDGPSNRQEASDAAAALQQLLADPAAAAQRAAAWRQQLLLGSSSAALLGLTADYTPQLHQQQLRRGIHQQRQSTGGAAAACSSPLAGPAWLAGSSGSPGGSEINAGCTLAATRSLICSHSTSATELVQGVRSSSSFLRPGSRLGDSRAGSPLPPLVLPRPGSRLAAQPSVRVAEEEGLAAESIETTCWPVAADAWPSEKAVAAGAAASAAAPHADDPAWDSFCCGSLAAALAVCMAEAVRQVEVGCAERGRLLAVIWNAYTSTLAATIELQQGQLQQLAGANANLEAGAGPACCQQLGSLIP